MKVGTPGFAGDRLREAREVRGLTAVSLSELVGISPQLISEYERDKSSPSPEVLQRIAAATNFPVHFFTLPLRTVERGAIFYRSMSAATKGARARAERRFCWLRDIVSYLSEFVQLPQAQFPDLRLPADPLLLSDDEIEVAAEEVRQYWELRDGPIANMVLLLENKGAVVARDTLGAETLEGLSEFVPSEQRPYIVLGTDKGSPVRWRFDAAHELGHIILHRNVGPNLLARSDQFKRIEQQAHRFAAAFLLPFAPFSDDLFGANLDNFRSLKLKWKTSIGMMIMRAHQGGLISQETSGRLWMNYSRNGWRKQEPFDDTMDVEEPRLLRRSFELVLDRGAQTPDDVLSTLGLNSVDVETLSGLPSGYLSGFSPVQLRGEKQPETRRPNDAPPADVIPLGFRRRTD